MGFTVDTVQNEDCWARERTCQSRRLFFFKYFLAKYFKYRLEKLMSDVRGILDLVFSKLTWLPKFWVLPFTLMRLRRNSSNAAMSMMPSSTGCVQSIVYLMISFFFFLPFKAEEMAAGFLALGLALVTFFWATGILAEAKNKSHH